MSQLNVDTLGSQTSTNVQLASGHTLKDKDGTAFDTQSDIKLLYSVSASNSATVDMFQSNTGWNTTDYSRFIVKARWIVPQDDDRRIYAALYYGTSLRSGTYEHAGQYYRIDGSDSGGYSQSEQSNYIELTSGTAGNSTRENVAFTFECIPTGDGTLNAPLLTWFEYDTYVKYENALSWRVNRHGQFDSQSYVDGIRFYASAGNIGSGHFDFYGVRRG
tara:strand:+ start:54 stop:707 length:654 start_codon:yes stop_codon:yes gene_type:complete